MSSPPKLSKQTWEQLRDWLVPEPEEPGFTATDEAFAIWEERKAIRALLTAEADRAERGNG